MASACRQKKGGVGMSRRGGSNVRLHQPRGRRKGGAASILSTVGSLFSHGLGGLVGGGEPTRMTPRRHLEPSFKPTSMLKQTTLGSTSSSGQRRAITTTLSSVMVDFLSQRPFGTPRPAILATMFRPTSKPWPMKWPRPTIDLSSSVHSLCAPRPACVSTSTSRPTARPCSPTAARWASRASCRS
jgi:hypothetical protein